MITSSARSLIMQRNGVDLHGHETKPFGLRLGGGPIIKT